MVIYLESQLPVTSCDLYLKRNGQPLLFQFGLAPSGVYIDHLCYQRHGKLLPYLSTLTYINKRFISVALSLKSPSPGVTRHSRPMELGLSSCKKHATTQLTHRYNIIQIKKSQLFEIILLEKHIKIFIGI